MTAAARRNRPMPPLPALACALGDALLLTVLAAALAPDAARALGRAARAAPRRLAEGVRALNGPERLMFAAVAGGGAVMGLLGAVAS